MCHFLFLLLFRFDSRYFSYKNLQIPNIDFSQAHSQWWIIFCVYNPERYFINAVYLVMKRSNIHHQNQSCELICAFIITRHLRNGLRTFPRAWATHMALEVYFIICSINFGLSFKLDVLNNIFILWNLWN